ncbi:DUF1376 domain-containing protein [Raoultella ornithinolytica]|uniref:DUF1376 domain-containing protein n=1 Tax=Raoultella ornithinolytica TaxID=54291 RepID=UPI001D0F51F1|nr:DUF1376 domain-containing protein [Raoultella ornithinolytica]
MAALPYMQLYIADYLADTMHLSTEEHGAYLLLMFNYWQTGRAIPKSRLAKIARVSDDRWKELEPVIKEFFEEENESWVHLRIERDIENVTSSPRGKKLPTGESLKGFNGYVYFIRNPLSGLIKIGYSKNPWARLSELRRNYGSELCVVATIKTVDKSEVSIHATLSKFRVEGEWFTESECIKSLILRIVAGEITTVEATNAYASNYCSEPTAPTNTDPDIDTDLKENPSLRGREIPAIQEPQYLEGLDIPIGKFTMYDNWRPSQDWPRLAATWGIALPVPAYLPTELAEFTAYWESEGKVFTQVQWEQKFARSVVTARAKSKPQPVTGGNGNAGLQPVNTASRAVQEIQAARERWEQKNGLTGGGHGMEALDGHGGDIFEPMDPEERGGAFGYVDGSDWVDE